MTVVVTQDRTAAVLAALRELTRKEVLIGVPAENADRDPAPGEENIPSNAALGYIHEFGMPEENIPARPHLLPAVEEIKDKAVERLRKAGQQALSGRPEEAEKALHVVGLMGQNAVRGRITNGPFAPLSPVTIKHRKARGRTGEKPLLDTGNLRQAYTYVVVAKNRR